MKRIGLIIITLCLIGTITAQRQGDFIYKSLDQAAINLWLAETDDVSVLSNLEADLQSQWRVVYNQIIANDLVHFDKDGFLNDQDYRVTYLHELVKRKKNYILRKEVYIFLTDFKEVRDCFTDDFYLLDAILDSYQAYLDVHEIIHDQMMGLYEWTEFVWHVDQLKCSIDELESKFSVPDGPAPDPAIQAALEKLRICLTTLDESLGDAYRPDFEVPCNDLHIAFKDLFRAYSQTLTM